MVTATQHLRDSTHVRHAALERAPIARDLMSPHLTAPRYLDILSVWSSAWAVLEQRIHASPLALAAGDLLPPRRAHLAQDDLLYWQKEGYRVVPPAVVDHRLIEALQPADIPGLLGVCYVARGASLGSKVIAGHLKKVLPLGSGQGISFFAHECDQSLTWPQWSHSLEASLAGPDALAQAVLWANATFAALEDAFVSAPAAQTVNA